MHRFGVLALTASCLACLLINSAAAQEVAAPAVPAVKVEKTKAAPRGRLPAYYGEAVDEAQREAIYAVQREYAERIAKLKAELVAVMQQRDAKIEALLTPDQQKKVAELKAAAKAKRDAEHSAEAAPAKKAPAKDAG
jgi:hypothetical protein